MSATPERAAPEKVREASEKLVALHDSPPVALNGEYGRSWSARLDSHRDRLALAWAALREALASQPPAGASAGEAPGDAQIDAALWEISDAAENHNDMYGLPMESAEWAARFRLVIRNLIAAPSSSVAPPQTVGDLMKWREAVLEEVYTAILMMPKGDKAARFDVCTMIRKMKESAPPSEQAP